MKRITRLTALVAVLMVCLQVAVFAQSKEEVTKAYNDAMTLIEENPAGAVDALNAVIEQCATLGEEGDELKGMAQSKIPALQYKVGYNSYKAKDYASAITSFTTAKVSATEINDEELVKRIDKMLPQLHYANGMGKLKAKDTAGALAEFDAAIELNPKYAKAYYGKSKAYRSPWDQEKMFANVDKALESADDKTKATIIKSTASFLYKKASSANKSKKYQEALDILERAMALDTIGSPARYDYQRGKAFQGLNQKSKACAAYKKVTGKYAKNAKYQMTTVLKCN